MNTNFIETTIYTFSVYRVRNKTAGEDCWLSTNIVGAGAELKELLTHYFVSSFKSSEYFNFHHDIDLDMNETFMKFIRT